MGLKEWAKTFWQTVIGLVIAAAGLGLLFVEYKGGVEHAHTTHIFLYVAIFGVGMLVVSPTLVGGGARSLVMLVLDAKKGGLRWTDPPGDDKDKKP